MPGDIESRRYHPVVRLNISFLDQRTTMKGAAARAAVYWLRRENLKKLIELEFRGQPPELASRLGWPEELVQRFLTSGRNRRILTDLAAREIERLLGLEPNWLTSNHIDRIRTQVAVYLFKVLDPATGAWHRHPTMLSEKEAAERFGQGNYEPLRWTRELVWSDQLGNTNGRSAAQGTLSAGRESNKSPSDSRHTE